MRKALFFFVIGLLSIFEVHAQEINITSLTSLIELISEPNHTFYISTPIDLKGNTIKIPSGSTIVFSEGRLYNGTLIGNDTKIIVDSPFCLGVSMKGTWVSSNINDLWFDDEFLDNNSIMSNINTLQSDDVKNIIHLYRDYLVDIDNKTFSAFVLQSNTELHIHSTISIMPNGNAKYGIISIIGKTNICVDGGTIIGDVGMHRYIPNSTNEWGMGINVVASHNITISNLKVSLCTGDGIYLGGYREDNYGRFDNACKDILLYNVVCNQNRRQGLSIVHAKDVTIINCQFLNTGEVEFTKPGHGIDIEPNISNNRNMSVSDITILGCKFMGNKGKCLSTAHYISTDINSNIKKITIKDSFFDGEITIRSGSFFLDGIRVPNISVYLSIHNLGDIEIENSTISGGLYLHSSVADKRHPEYTGILTNFVLSNCHFTNQVKNKGNYILSLSGDMKRMKRFEFINCDFEQSGSGNKELVNRRHKSVCVLRNCKFSR